MDIDPKKIVETGIEAFKAIRLINSAVAALPTAGKARRKADWDPQRDKSRRKSGVSLRLRTGIWVHFHYKTGYGKFEVLETPDVDTLMSAFIDEGVNYQFTDRDSPNAFLVPSTIARPAVDHACAKWMELEPERRHAVLLADEIGYYILSNFNVRMIDRRQLPKPISPLGSLGLLLDKAKSLFWECNNNQMRRKDDYDPDRNNDRRKSGVGARLRTGIWIQFHRKTGYGITEVLQTPELGNLIHALIAEGERYEFADRDAPEVSLQPSMIATPAVDFARAKWTQLPAEQRRAFVLTQEVANYVLSNYNVRMTDRRRDPQHHAVAG
jgi:hypothetical protein